MKKKPQKFPDEKELAEIRELLSKGPASRPLRPNADAVERLKYSLCAEFVRYFNRKRITQKEFARELGIDEALVSKILHYLYDDFTVDRLVKYLTILYPKMEIRLHVA